VTYTRPVLEYNSVVLIYLVDLIENVQRNFSKRIRSLSSLLYPELSALLDLERLS
jgi:hypothetical protein